jgi:2-amino-4-hydroxy-6-hydroxymethyldihydropteridine diphosphokinase
MHIVHLGIGTNEGNKLSNIETSLVNISDSIGFITKKSSLYETKAWGIEDQENFINLTIEVETALFPLELIEKLLAIENKMGRKREIKWASRIIDIDILFFENYRINTSNLTIPHPYITYRNFVLAPLLDICPEFMHPTLKKTIKQLNTESKDNGWIKKL